MTVFIASELVMKSMYAAEASGFSLASVIAKGRLVPPVATGMSESAPSRTVKPTLSPIAFMRSAISQVPPSMNTPSPWANACHASSGVMPLKSGVT